jgi:hypothetical protein
VEGGGARADQEIKMELETRGSLMLEARRLKRLHEEQCSPFVSSIDRAKSSWPLIGLCYHSEHVRDIPAMTCGFDGRDRRRGDCGIARDKFEGRKNQGALVFCELGEESQDEPTTYTWCMNSGVEKREESRKEERYEENLP